MTLKKFKEIANDETYLGEPAYWWVLGSGRCCEIVHEENMVQYPFYSIRVHATDEEYPKYEDTMGVIGQTTMDELIVNDVKNWVHNLEASI